METGAYNENFWRRVLRVALPLLVWIAQFAFSYGLASAQCSPGGMRPGGPDRLLLGAASLAALGAGALLLWRACRTWRRHGGAAGLADRAAFFVAVLALIAIAWTGMQLLLVAGCA